MRDSPVGVEGGSGMLALSKVVVRPCERVARLRANANSLMQLAFVACPVDRKHKVICNLSYSPSCSYPTPRILSLRYPGPYQPFSCWSTRVLHCLSLVSWKITKRFAASSRISPWTKRPRWFVPVAIAPFLFVRFVLP